MVRFDLAEFLRRGARCVDNSDLFGVRTTCCVRYAVEDGELHDLYVDPSDLARVHRLYDAKPCPLCGATEWDLVVADAPPIGMWTALLPASSRRSRLQEAEDFLRYFTHHSIKEPGFLPERDAAEAILRVLRRPEQAPEALEGVLDELARVERAPHYAGTGWFGFSNLVRFWVAERRGR